MAHGSTFSLHFQKNSESMTAEEREKEELLRFFTAIAFLSEKEDVVMLLVTDDPKEMDKKLSFNPQTATEPYPFPKVIFNDDCVVTTSNHLPIKNYQSFLKKMILEKNGLYHFIVRIAGTLVSEKEFHASRIMKIGP